MRAKKFLASALALTMAFGGAAVLPQNGQIGGTSISVSAETQTLADVTMYIRGSALADDIPLPAGNITEYKPPISGKVDRFEYIDGDKNFLTLENGVIKPEKTIWYSQGGFLSTWPAYEGQEPSRIDYSTGSATIMLYSGSNSYKVKITVDYYDNVYANKVMDDYIAANITKDMTTKKKVELICAFVAGYDYYYGYQSAVDAIASGKGGDCWASVNIIVAMCDKLGIKAWGRNGNRDPGAGSGHRNVVVEDGDHYLEAEAGYSGKAPRYYSVSERSSLFSTAYDGNGGLRVYQYDGCEDTAFDLVIPETIDGMTVTAIDDNFIYGNDYVSSVSIPSTVKSIGLNAFTYTPLLKEINIPASVESIERFVCGYDDKGKTITVDPKNPWFTAENNVIYNKDKTKVICANTADISSLPDTVEEIAEEAFYNNCAIKSITVPGKVKTIETGAFAFCDNLKTVNLEEGVETIEAHAFLDKDIQITIPDSVTYIDPLAFTYAGGQMMGNITVKCSSTSYAAKAIEAMGRKEITVVYTDKFKRGDVNGDGKVDITDVTITISHVRGVKLLDDERAARADVTENGKVDITDVTTLIAIVRGIK